MPLIDISRSDARVSSRSQQRLLLWIGLGGLLVLLVALGISAVSFLREIERRHEDIRADFLSRFRVLEQLRNDVYRSGTRVHDFLLESDPNVAARDREEVLASRRRIDALANQYARTLRPEERELFAALRHELSVYFDAVLPVLEWTPKERQRQVDIFVRDELHPRRAVMLRIADEIETLNGRDMDRNASDTHGLFVNYRRLLVVLVGLTLGIGALIASFSLSRIMRAEAESEARFSQLEETKAALQALSGQLVEAQETERRRLSRELHDEIGQGLWAMVLGLGNATAALERDQRTQAREHIAAAKRLAEDMVRSVRSLALLLRPSVLDDLGLVPAIKWLAREVTRTSGLQVDVAAATVEDTLIDEHRTCVFRVVQEALMNCRRHANATAAYVRIEQNADTLHLTVSDDGRGCAPEERGLGVLGMEERVTHLGGRFCMESRVGQGTVVNVELPLRDAVAPA